MAQIATYSHVASYIVASNTELAARMRLDENGSFYCMCPSCSERVNLTEDGWLLPNTYDDLPADATAQDLLEYLLKSSQCTTIEELREQRIAQNSKLFLDEDCIDFIHLTFHVPCEQSTQLFKQKDLGLYPLPHQTETPYYCGLYRCDHCGELFLAFRSQSPELPRNFTEIDIYQGDQKIRMEISKTQRRNDEDSSMECVLDIESGLYTYDGNMTLASFMTAETIIPSVLGNRQVYETIRSLMPAKDQGPEWRPETDNALTLVLANRFKGYPEEFFESCRVCFDDGVLNNLTAANQMYYGNPRGSLFNSACELPVRYEDLLSVVNLSWLPQTKAVRRAAFSNPLIIAAARYTTEPLFENQDIFLQLISDKLGPARIYSMRKRNNDSKWFWRMFIERYGELYTLQIAMQMDPYQLANVHRIDSMHADELEEFTKMSKPTLAKGLVFKLQLLAFELNHDFKADDGLSYPDEAYELEWKCDTHSIQLPATPKEIVCAGNVLHNCLVNWKGNGQDSVIYLATDLEHQKVVAAIEVDVSTSTVLQAYTACNEPIPDEGPLHEAYEAWLDCKGLDS